MRAREARGWLSDTAVHSRVYAHVSVDSSTHRIYVMHTNNILLVPLKLSLEVRAKRGLALGLVVVEALEPAGA